jgi:DNA repair photolyase
MNVMGSELESIKRKSLLYKSDVEYADYCINHIEGCSHGCRYPCYAMMMKKRFGIIKTYNEWLKPKIVSNAIELLDNELPRMRDKIKCVHLCFTSDPFMYKQNDVKELTLRIIKKLKENGIKCTVLTKGILPDDLTNIDIYGKDNLYGISLVSFDKNFKDCFEPYSAPYEERLEALEYLHRNGLKTWVSMEPYPTPNLVKQNLSDILERIGFTDRVVFGRLNYNVKSSQFPMDKEFYNQCSKIVIDFCQKNGIEYHIKYKTMT